MVFGTLYTRPVLPAPFHLACSNPASANLFELQFNPRSSAILAVAKATNLELELVTIGSSKEAPGEYRALNPLAKIPTFVGSDGYVLSECIAVAIYSALDANPRQTYLGKKDRC